MPAGEKPIRLTSNAFTQVYHHPTFLEAGE
jgi:hypothetical protein